jgi:tetratricopeptide (TPR) repeat protein
MQQHRAYWLISLILVLLLAADISAQNNGNSQRFGSEDTKPRNNSPANNNQSGGTSQRFGLARNVNNVTIERSQRFGVQQVGEVAATTLRTNIVTRPKTDPYNNNLGKAAELTKTAKYEEAAEFYQKATKLQPRAAEPYIGLAYIHTLTNNYAQALQYYRQALVYEPQNNEARLGLGVALYLSGGINEAINEYQQLLNSSKTPNSLIYFNLALAYAHQGNFPESIKHYQNAIAQNKNTYPEAYNNLGLVYEALDDLAAAEKHLQLAITQSPQGYAPAHYNLSRIYTAQALGQPDQTQTQLERATRELLKAIKLQPQFPEAYLALGNLYLLRGRLAATDTAKDATNAFNKALEQRQNIYPLAYESLAIIYTGQGKKAEALAAYRTAMEQYNGYSAHTLFNLLATIEERNTFLIGNEIGRPDNPGNLKNIAAKTTAKSANPELTANQEIRFRELLKALQRYEEAEEELKDSADVRYCGGLAYAAAGKPELAIEEFAKAATLSQGKDQDSRMLQAKALQAIQLLLAVLVGA